MISVDLVNDSLEAYSMEHVSSYLTGNGGGGVRGGGGIRGGNTKKLGTKALTKKQTHQQQQLKKYNTNTYNDNKISPSKQHTDNDDAFFGRAVESLALMKMNKFVQSQGGGKYSIMSEIKDLQRQNDR